MLTCARFAFADPVLWYESPAESWDEALPVGNGRLGAMVFGKTGSERIQLNEDTVWAGAAQSLQRPGAHEHLPEIRRLLFEGEYLEAEKMLENEFLFPHPSAHQTNYQTLGDLWIDSGQPESRIEYRRELDLEIGVARTEWTREGVQFSREVFASAPHGVLVVRLEASELASVDVQVRLTREGGATSSASDRDVILSGTAGQTIGVPGVTFEARARVIADGGTVTVSGNVLKISGADSVTLIAAAATDYRSTDPVAAVRARLTAAAAAGYETLEAEHVADHAAIFNRVALDLTGAARRRQPTDMRLNAVKDGSSDADLLATYFQFGRYLLMGSSRPGSMPANLQGLWNYHLDPPWNSGYVIDINLPMNYWLADVGNLSEMQEPLWDLLDNLRASGRTIARDHYAMRGWVAHTSTDVWWRNRPNIRARHGMWPTGGAWLSRHMWEAYVYGQDEVFLSDRAYPVLKGAAEFFLDWLVEEPGTGLLVSGPSTSPENRFISDGKTSSVSMGPAMDQQIIRDLFTNVLAAADVLGIDDEFVADVQETLEHLASPLIGSDGRLMEWRQEFEEYRPGHRHISHAFGLHPGTQITVRGSPEVAQAIQKSIEHRLSAGSARTGWSMAWLINMWARLENAEKAYEALGLLASRMTMDNLLDEHPRGSRPYRVFQIDGNLGGAAGIAEMLLQSHQGEMHLLPALPPAWSDGAIEGLKARGGFDVSMAWSEGALSMLAIHSRFGEDLQVRVASGDLRTLTVARGETGWFDGRLSGIDPPQTLAAPAAVVVVEASRSALTLEWRPPLLAARSVTDYQVQYREYGETEYRNWPLGGQEGVTTITDLASGETYEVRVRARNSDGWGAWSDPVQQATLELPSPKLSTLSLSGIDLDFDPQRFSYTENASNALSSTAVTATPADADASVTVADGNGSSEGSTRTVRLVEGTNTITVTVAMTADGETKSNAYTVTVTRAAQPTVTLAADADAVTEGAAITFTVTSSEAFTSALMLPVAVAGDGALLVAEAPTSVTFTAGSTAAEIAMRTQDDAVVEADGSVTVTLLAGDGYALGNDVSATVTVEDNDAAAYAVTADPAEIEEGTGTTVMVSINNGVTFAEAQALELEVTGELSAADYTLEPLALTLPAGSSSVSARLVAVDDAVVEGMERSTVAARVDGAAVGWAAVAVEDDDEAVFEVTAEPTSIKEGDMATVTVTVAGDVTFAADVGIDLAVTGGVSANDYELAPASLTLAAGQASVSATLTATGDGEVEDAETATVTARVDGAVIGSAAVAVRDALDDASLAALELSDVDIGVFDAEVTAYAAEVSHGIESTTVQATPGDANASVEITDAVGGTLGTQRTSALAEGANEIAARVTAEDGETSRTYVVTVTRAASVPWGARLPDLDITLTDTSAPTGLWSDGQTVWVSDINEGVLAYALSGGGRTPGRDIDVAAVSRPSGLWSDGATLMVADYDGGARAYRLSDGSRLPNQDLYANVLAQAGNDNPVGLWSDGAKLLVADNANGRVYAYALSDGRRARRAEFSLRSRDLPTMQPYGLWSDGQTVLASHWTRGSVRAYRLSDGARQSARDIDAQARGNSYPRGLWSDGVTLWVVDYEDRKLYAYAVRGLVEQPLTAAESIARLTALSLDGIDIGRFSGHMYDYIGAVSEGLTQTTLAATPIEGASLSISPPDAASDTPGHQIVMGQDVRQLAVAVTVTSADGLTTREYRVALHRDVVRFEDANLGEAVASALGKDSASPVATADLARLQTLDLSRVAVGDLGWLKFAANLRELFLGANRVADLSPLDSLSVRVRHTLTPGLGNMAWTEDDVWNPIGALGGSQNSPLGYGMVFMADGHLATIRAVDRSKVRQASLEVWDVSDPSYPVRVKVYRNEDTYRLRDAHSLGLWNRAGRIVLVAQTHDGVAFFDVTEIRTRLTLLAELDIAGVKKGDYAGAWWVGVQAPYVYVAAVGHGLFVVDARDPSAPRVVRNLPTGRLGGISPGSVFPLGNLLVVAEPSNRGYATMDISDPSRPALIEARDGASGYSHLFTAGLLLTSGNVLGRTVRSSSSTGDVRGEPNRMYVHRVAHDGHASYVGEAGEGLGPGGYGSYQDGYFFGGFSDRVTKFTIDPPTLVGSGTSGRRGRDEDFTLPLGNLVFVGNDHNGPSALIPHQAEPDERGPEVVWMHPADGATGVATTSRVGVSMSDQVAVDSLVATNFRVRPRGGEPVSGQLSVNQNNVNFSPDAPLTEDTVYEVEVCGLADLVGNLGGCTAATFTTGGSGAAAPSCSVGLLAPAVAGTEVSYKAVSVGAPTSYEWRFGDGQQIGPQELGRAAVTHAAPGRYSATLTVTNEHGKGSCSGVRVVHAAVTAKAPAASSSIVVWERRFTWQEQGDVKDRNINSDVFVTNPDAGTVTRLNNEHAKAWETAVGEAPRTLAISPDGDVWVAVEGDGDIVVLNRTGGLVRRIDLGYGAAPFGVVFAPDGRSAYVTLGGSGRLLRLSPSGTITGNLVLGSQPRGIAVSADSQRIFVTRFVSAFAASGAKGEIYEVDAASFTLTRTHELAFDAGPDTESSGRGVPNYLSQARIAPDGGTLWAPSKKDNIARGTLRDGKELDFETQTRAIVSQVDLTTNTETLARRIDFNDRDLAQSLVFTPLGDAFVVAFQGSNVIEVWDANTLTRLSEVNVGRAPMGLAFRADGRQLYVHNFLDRSVTVLNTIGLLDGTVNQPVVVKTVPTVAEEALAAEVLRGKRVFYNAADRRMNRDGYISCASCHLDGGSDGMVWDRTQFGEGLRNTIDLRGRRGTNGGFVHWTANFDEIQDFEHDMRDAFGGSGFMSEADFRTGTRDVPLGDEKAGVSADLDALAAYVGSLDATPDSPHRAADGSLTAAGAAGKAVFESQGCARCHLGRDFTDDASHDVGTIRTSSGTGLTGINTPTLKGLWLGSPYLHDGSAATLVEVLSGVAHMGGALTGEEKAGLETYLLQIDDSEPAPRELSTGADATLAELTLSGVYIGTFSAEATVYRASVAYGVEQTTVTAMPTDVRATVQVTPPDADPNTAGDQVALAVGANEIMLQITAEDGEATRSYTVTVTRMPPVPIATLTAVTAAVTEGSAATFTVTLDRAPAESLAVAVMVEEDGDMLSDLPPTAVTVGMGEMSATLEVPMANDRVSETASTVTAALVAGTGYEPGAVTTATVTVEDDDVAALAVAVAPGEIEEGDMATVTVSITNGVTFAEVQELLLTVSGMAPEDYVLTPAPVTLVAGDSTATATFSAALDGVQEEPETVRIEASLDGVVVGSARLTVADPPQPVATLTASTSPVSEGTAASFEVALDRAPFAPLTVTVLVTQEGAMLLDTPPPSVTIEAGSAVASLSLTTDDDRVDEADGVVTATLTSGAGYELGMQLSATVTVTDDDTAAFEVTAAPSEVVEGEAATVTVSLSNGVTFADDQPVSLSVTGVSVGDYELDPGSILLLAGAASATATLTAAADGIAEEPETALIEAAVGGSAVGSASVRIMDPAAPPAPVIEGVAQVGGTLEATFGEAPQSDVTYQWLRGDEEIAEAAGSSYAPAVSDAGRSLSVRVTRRGLSRTSAPTAPVWPAPVNPPLAAGEEELVGATLTLGSTDAFLVDIAGYGQFGEVRFGSLAGGDFDIGGALHAVSAAAVNNQGKFLFGTSPHMTDGSGPIVYWNEHRIGAFAAVTLAGQPYWEAAATQPRHEYARYWGGASDGVRVALSVRGTVPLPAVSITAVSTSVAEGSAAEYTVTVDEAPRADLAVSVSVTDEVSVLVSAPPSTVTVAAGAMSATLTLATDDDRVDEADGAVKVELLAGEGYELGAAISAAAAVTDNDEGTFEVAAEPLEIAEGGSATVTVTVAGDVTFAADVGIDLAVTGGVSADDYELAPASLTLAAGQASVSATLTATGDGEVEDAETATVTARVDGAVIGSAAVAVRDALDDASLAALELSDVDIGVFDAEVTAYAAEVSHGIESTTVQATPGDANASVEITDAVGSTLGTQRTSALAEGANEIAARVTAEDGEASRTYAVTVTRAGSVPWGARLPGLDITLTDTSAPAGLWSDGQTVWVSDISEGVLAYALSGGSRTPGWDIDVAAVIRPSGLWSDGATLMVADYDGGVRAYRLSDGGRLSGEDLDTDVLAAAGNDIPMGLWSDGANLLVADNADGWVYAYALPDGSRVADAEFSLRSGPYGLWSDGQTVLASHWTPGSVRAYRLSDGARQSARDINTRARGNSYPRGLWSDGETLWVVDYEDRKLYAYAVPGLRGVGGALTGLVLTNRAKGVSGAEPGEPVSIPDPGLRGRIGAALGKAPGETAGANELAALTVLDARGAGVTDLSGIEYAVNLTGLDLGLNPIGDLRPLGSLAALESLNLDGAVSDPWALSGLTSLRRLSVRGNGLSDAEALSSLTGLEVLDLGDNRIADLGPLVRLAELRTLRLDGNAISGLAPLAALTELRHLSLRGNAVADLGPLAGLARLETLDLRDNRVTDVAPLAGLPGLVRLDAEGNRIGDFTVLEGSRRLRVLGAGEQDSLRAPR